MLNLEASYIFFHGLLSVAGVYLFGFSESIWSLQAGLLLLCLAGLDLSAVGSGNVASVMTIVTWWLLKCVCPQRWTATAPPHLICCQPGIVII